MIDLFRSFPQGSSRQVPKCLLSFVNPQRGHVSGVLEAGLAVLAKLRQLTVKGPHTVVSGRDVRDVVVLEERTGSIQGRRVSIFNFKILQGRLSGASLIELTLHTYPLEHHSRASLTSNTME